MWFARFLFRSSASLLKNKNGIIFVFLFYTFFVVLFLFSFEYFVLHFFFRLGFGALNSFEDRAGELPFLSRFWNFKYWRNKVLKKSLRKQQALEIRLKFLFCFYIYNFLKSPYGAIGLLIANPISLSSLINTFQFYRGLWVCLRFQDVQF